MRSELNMSNFESVVAPPEDILPLEPKWQRIIDPLVVRARLNIKTVFPCYGNSHVKDKTVARPSYL